MKRKTLCLLLALVMMLVPFTALAADGSAAGQIVILHTNDVHCAIDQTVEEDGTVSAIGYAGVAAYLGEMQKEYGAGNVTLIDGGDDLSSREQEILVRVCRGLSNQEIADELFISKRTVDKHRANILEKTGCKNTASLVV